MLLFFLDETGLFANSNRYIIYVSLSNNHDGMIGDEGCINGNSYRSSKFSGCSSSVTSVPISINSPDSVISTLITKT